MLKRFVETNNINKKKFQFNNKLNMLKYIIYQFNVNSLTQVLKTKELGSVSGFTNVPGLGVKCTVSLVSHRCVNLSVQVLISD